MRVLSVYPEHVEAFRRGLRTIETRTWSLDYRGPLALYATKRDPLSKAAFDDPLASAVMWALGEGKPDGMKRVDLVRGAITVVVDLVNCLPIVGPETNLFNLPDDVTGVLRVSEHDLVRWNRCPDGLGVSWRPRCNLTAELRFGMYVPGNFGLVFANPRPLARPVKLPRSQVPQGRPWPLIGEAFNQVFAQVSR
jgi:hypothetical protein